MKNNYILDCTLRDGGYCNNWNFKKENIRKIVDGLSKSGIDIIECGFLTNSIDFSEDITKYNEIKDLAPFIQRDSESLYVLMANYGEYDFDSLPYNEGIIDGIRLAFHKEDVYDALGACKKIKNKGYKVFVQPMVSLRYSDMEFLQMLDMVNMIEPYAFYIVDSFGSMKREELLRLFCTVDHNLEKEILVGYHGHNNLQLAFSNAQALVDINTARHIIIDSSVFGMGRGAGNLNTELFIQYIDSFEESIYQIEYLLKIIDNVILRFYEESYWGYSLANYLSAVYYCHPSYGSYLEDKKTLTVEDMKNIFEVISSDKKAIYDEKYIHDLYLDYLKGANNVRDDILKLKKIFCQKNILVIAPGKSIEKEKILIETFYQKHELITIAVNFNCECFNTDYIFVSNIRRFQNLDNFCKNKTIATSNITDDDVKFKIEQKNFLNDLKIVEDNATLMLISLLIQTDANKIYIAGLDGYSSKGKGNYVVDILDIKLDENRIEIINKGISQKLIDYASFINIEYITKHENISFDNLQGEQDEIK